MSTSLHVVQMSTIFVPPLSEPYATSSVIVHVVTKCGRMFRREEFSTGNATAWECLPNVTEASHV